MLPPPDILGVHSWADAAALSAVGAFVVAVVGWGGRGIRKAARALAAMERVLNRELNPDHGGSMKDDMHGTAVALKRIDERIDHLTALVDSVVEANELVLPDVLDAVASARMQNPPRRKGKAKE